MPGWNRSARSSRRIRCSRSGRSSSSTAKIRRKKKPGRIPGHRPEAAPRTTHASAAWRTSNVLHVHDLELLHPSRSPDLGDVARELPDEGLRDGGRVGDLPLLDVGLVLAHDLVADRLAARGIRELHRRPEHHAAIVLEERRIDHLRIRELRLELDDAALDEALALARGLILGVLGDVALRARFRDGGDDAGPVHRLQAVELGAEHLGTVERDGDLVHGRVAWSDWISYARISSRWRMPRQAARAPARVV